MQTGDTFAYGKWVNLQETFCITIGPRQVIIGNPGSEMMEVVQPDIAGKPLYYRRQFIV
jgi:hypothetical protein